MDRELVIGAIQGVARVAQGVAPLAAARNAQQKLSGVISLSYRNVIAAQCSHGNIQPCPQKKAIRRKRGNPQ
jgi:hypothetical protein